MATPPVLIDVPAQLATERLVLTGMHRGDGPALFEAVQESLPALRQFLSSLTWVASEPTLQAFEVMCRTAEANFLARTDLSYTVRLRGSGELLGVVGLHRPVWATPKFEAGYWCRSSKTGRGYTAEAVAAITAMAFDALAAARVELITDAQNHGSRQVALACGFALEGILRDERRDADGSLRSMCVYARTARQA